MIKASVAAVFVYIFKEIQLTRHRSFSTFVKVLEKLTFLTP